VAILPLKYVPDIVLEIKARRIKEIDGTIRKLARDMIETMHENHGVGLAANQVGFPLRMAVIQLPEDDEATVLINPQVTHRDGDREIVEGCLSIPGYQGLVKRSKKVRVKAMDIDGRPIRIKAEDDLLAQALEHETDHLNGVLYISRLVDKDSLWKIEEEDAGKEDGEPAALETAPPGE